MLRQRHVHVRLRRRLQRQPLPNRPQRMQLQPLLERFALCSARARNITQRCVSCVVLTCDACGWVRAAQAAPARTLSTASRARAPAALPAPAASPTSTSAPARPVRCVLLCACLYLLLFLTTANPRTA